VQTILVIDDDPCLRAVCRALLEKDGYRVVEAPDGKAGLDAFGQERPDLAVCDVVMPVMDGLGFLREVRRRHPGAKVVVMSAGGACAPGDFLHAALQIGAAAALDKTSGMARLLDAVRVALAGEAPAAARGRLEAAG
jgi:CheY-like chemotaxis protein